MGGKDTTLVGKGNLDKVTKAIDKAIAATKASQSGKGGKGK